MPDYNPQFQRQQMPPAQGQQPPQQFQQFQESPVSKAASARVASITKEVNNVSRQMRVIEERFSSLRRKTQVTDQNMLNIHKKLHVEVEAIKESLHELRAEVYDALDKIKIISSELKTCASKEELRVYKKYIDLWEPITFVTKEAYPQAIKDAVEEYLAFREEGKARETKGLKKVKASK